MSDETEGCTGCSFVADHFDGVVPHLNGHDVTLVAASLAPLELLRAYKQRMGWRFPWVSSLGSDFNYDFGVAFTDEQRANEAEYNFPHVDEPGPQREGMSAFAIQDGKVHHTYSTSTYDRGVEALMGTYQYLDLAPAGRNEDNLTESWWRVTTSTVCLRVSSTVPFAEAEGTVESLARLGARSLQLSKTSDDPRRRSVQGGGQTFRQRDRAI